LHAGTAQAVPQICPQVEKFAVEGGIILIKLWLEVGMEEQEIRFTRASRIRCGIGSEPDGIRVVRALV
jgi:polyphosphate kinase 2 (PPK2 family)